MPISAAAAGVAVGKFALDSFRAARDFDKAFTQIATISNAATQDIERWQDEVRGLAGETAKAPTELADALFFVSSAGLDASQIMPVLEQSAKAAAVGLGTTSDVANITASALNAYADSGLTATQVTDTLVAAVREGRAEPEEFAAALGRILPIASQAGVSFDQVTASLAALSNIGLDVNEGVTAMRGVLQAVVAPGAQAAEAMSEIGLSAQDMLDVISEEGILGALRLLDERAKANTSTQAEYIGVLRQVVPNVRALTGVLGLTGQEAEKVQGIYDNVRRSTGALGDAFAELSRSDAFKLEQSLNDIRVAGEELAAVALPAIADILSELADAVQDTLGPFQSLFDMLGEVSGRADESGFSLYGLFKALQTLANPIEQIRHPIGRWQEAWREVTGVSEEAAEAVRVLTMRERAVQLGLRGGIPVVEQSTDAHRDLARAHRVAAAAARDQRLALLAVTDTFLGIVDSAKAVTEAQRRLNELERRGREDTKAYEQAVLDALAAQVGLEDAVLSYGQELADSGAKQRDVINKLREAADSYGIQDDAVRDLIQRIRAYIRALEDIPSTVTTSIRTTGEGGVSAQQLGAQGGLHTTLARDTLIFAHAGERVDITPRVPGLGAIAREASRLELSVHLDRRRFGESLDREYATRGL